MERKQIERTENPAMYANDREFREEMQRFDQVLQQEDLDMANIDQ